MRRDGGSVFPAHANTGDPNGPVRGLSANEIARALISIMAGSMTSSNQRPDTLMQDRKSKSRPKPLATHGRTIQMGQLQPPKARFGTSDLPSSAEGTIELEDDRDGPQAVIGFRI